MLILLKNQFKFNCEVKPSNQPAEEKDNSEVPSVLKVKKFSLCSASAPPMPIGLQGCWRYCLKYWIYQCFCEK